jgi:3-oxoacyl-[acyl-carrier-protein] synthase-1
VNAVQSIGMACPLGLTAPSAYAAIRAGLDRFRELPYRDDDGEPLRGSALSLLGTTTQASQRWTALLRLALADALQGSPASAAEAPVLLALPEQVEVDALDLSSLLGPNLKERAQIFVGGPCAGYLALHTARDLLHEGRASLVVVAAADSLIGARRLLEWSRQKRLLTEKNSDGVIPGEAAAAMVLVRRTAKPLGRVLGIGFGKEPGLLSNDVPLRGQGIVSAARAALAECRLELHDVDLRLSDAAGESYHFKEQVLAVSRLLRQNKDSFPLWRAAAHLGHTGSAAGLCNLVIALSAARAGRFPGQRAIAYAGDDGGDRAALVLEPSVYRPEQWPEQWLER